jgi:hypothetical protein
VARVNFWGARWSINDVGSSVNPYCIGSLGITSIASNILTIPCNNGGNNYFIPGPTKPNAADGKIFYLETQGWKMSDPGSGTGEIPFITFRINTSGADYFLNLTVVRVDANGFNMRLRGGTNDPTGAFNSIITTGTTKYAWATYELMDIIIDTTNPSSRTFQLKMGTSTVSSEFTSTISPTSPTTYKIDYFAYLNAGTASSTLNLKPLMFWQGDSTNDAAKAEDMNSATVNIAVGAGTYQDFSTPTPNQTNANKYLNCDDWQTGANDGDTTIVADAGTVSATLRQSFVTNNPSVTNMMGLYLVNYARGNVAAKNTTFKSLITDGTNNAVGPGVVAPDATTYEWITASFATNPAGGAWVSLSGIEIGIQHEVGSADIGALTATQGEAFGTTVAIVPPSTSNFFQFFRP